MTVTGLERMIPALGIDKMLEQGVPQATLDRVAPGVKSQDLNNLFGALDSAIPGSAMSSSRTPMSASPPASIRSAPKPNWKARRPAPSRCASSTARCFWGR